MPNKVMMPKNVHDAQNIQEAIKFMMPKKSL